MKEKSIYLLEDDPDIQDVIKYILTKGGYKVFAFEKVKDFNEQLEKEVPDLFILDISLPDGNGIEVSKRLTKDKGLAAPVILMSADIVNERKALEAGARNFIGKPFRMEEFLFTVGDLLAA
jgi:two-component system phosphate regulon response regulator PhoB